MKYGELIEILLYEALHTLSKCESEEAIEAFHLINNALGFDKESFDIIHARQFERYKNLRLEVKEEFKIKDHT
jgi:hypothetical protein